MATQRLGLSAWSAVHERLALDRTLSSTTAKRLKPLELLTLAVGGATRAANQWRVLLVWLLPD